jgi:hypothetical protein
MSPNSLTRYHRLVKYLFEKNCTFSTGTPNGRLRLEKPVKQAFTKRGPTRSVIYNENQYCSGIKLDKELKIL